MGWMQTTCREAARLMSARWDGPLPRWRALALRWHLRVCGDCREAQRQLDAVQRLSHALWSDDDRAAKPPSPRR